MSKSLLAKNQQNDSKTSANTSKGNNDLIATLRREIRDLKSERDKQLATKDRQIDHLTKLLDQQQQLQLTAVSENRELKERVKKLNALIETPTNFRESQIQNNIDNNNHIKNRITKKWYHFW